VSLLNILSGQPAGLSIKEPPEALETIQTVVFNFEEPTEPLIHESIQTVTFQYVPPAEPLIHESIQTITFN